MADDLRTAYSRIYEQSRLAALLAIAGVLVLVGGSALGVMVNPFGPWAMLAVVGGTGMVLGAFIFAAVVHRCPGCRGSLLGRQGGIYCPHCGAQLR